MPIREEALPVRVLEILFQTPERPRRILAEPEYFLSNRRCLLSETVRFREKVGINETKEMGELVFVAVVRSSGEQEHVIGLGSKARSEIVALGCCYLWLAILTRGCGSS